MNCHATRFANHSSSSYETNGEKETNNLLHMYRPADTEIQRGKLICIFGEGGSGHASPSSHRLFRFGDKIQYLYVDIRTEKNETGQSDSYEPSDINNILTEGISRKTNNNNIIKTNGKLSSFYRKGLDALTSF